MKCKLKNKPKSIITLDPDLFALAHSKKSPLVNFGMAAKIVICRKICKCSNCKEIINKNEKALKTIQNTNNGFWYNNYCENCYQIIN